VVRFWSSESDENQIIAAKYRAHMTNVRGFVWWSIYVRASSVKKAKEKHLPPIEAAIDGLEFEWEIFIEKENPGLVRMVTYQNIEGSDVTGVVVPVLQRAYCLANDWKIAGPHDLVSGKLQHVSGIWYSAKPSSKAPALDSVAFELEHGRISGPTSEGGWPVDGDPNHTRHTPR